MRRAFGGMVLAGLLIVGPVGCSDDGDGGSSATTAGGQQPTTAGSDAGGGTDDSGSTTTTGSGDTATTAAGGDTATTEAEDSMVAANDELIAAFCDAKEAYDAALQDSLDDPENAALQDRVRELGGTLGDLSTRLSAEVPTFTPEQSQQFEECQAG